MIGIKGRDVKQKQTQEGVCLNKKSKESKIFCCPEGENVVNFELKDLKIAAEVAAF